MALAMEEPSLNGRCSGPVEMPGLPHTSPLLLGAITQAEAETRGTHSCPAFPRLCGSLVIFLPDFQKEYRRRRDGGNPYKFLENKRRHTKEEQRGREGGSRGESETAECCWARRGAGRGSPCEGLTGAGVGL